MAAGEIARTFHERTKHTFESIRRGGRMLDWETKPDPFKRYEGLERISLPSPPSSEVSLLDALVREPVEGGLDLAALARVLVHGAGVLRKQTYGAESFYFRTYASAGALYPVELYVVCGAVEGLEPGVYHFDPLGKSLVLLGHGDHRATVVDACAGEPSVAGAQAQLVLTGIPWRTCWKYGERGYRHLYWDAGTILANVLALASSGGVPARIVMGFDDGALAELLGLDGVREFPLCVVPLGSGAESVSTADGPLELAAPPPPPGEERFRMLEGVHAAGVLGAEDVGSWRGPGQKAVKTLAPAAGPPVERVIRRRGSARAFGGRAMPADDLTTTLERATFGVPTDYDPGRTARIRPCLAAHDVDGLEPGAYVWEDDELRLLRRGDIRLDSAYLCLQQRLGGMGAATSFLMADLGEALERFGDRGYRIAQLEGGLTLGRMDLAAHALEWGATGLTFFDDDVTAFFSPRAARLDCMVVCAVGEKRGRPLPLA